MARSPLSGGTTTASKSPLLLLLRANSPVVVHVADTCTARVPTRLGLGDTSDRLTPAKVLGLTGVVQLTAGDDHTLALHGDGTVSAFGRNSYGQ